MRGRHCAAILRMLDVPETIATTIDDYLAVATRLGQDRQFRQTISREWPQIGTKSIAIARR